MRANYMKVLNKLSVAMAAIALSAASHADLVTVCDKANISAQAAD
jgi:hypothetical protein